MKIIRNKNNPLSKCAHFDKNGELFIKRGIKFGGQMRPKVTPREWFFLLWEACKEEGIPKEADKIIRNWVGSHVTQWRTRKSLEKKGYL